MTDPKEIIKLSDTHERILTQINEVAEGLKARRSNVLEARRIMSKATGVIRDFDDVAHLTILVTEVAQQEQVYSEVSKRLHRLKRLLNSPYFARIDFIEDGYDNVEEIYIGRHSLLDEKTHNFHVYDWRAPIASLYYDYGVGRGRFSIPAASHGELPPIEGDITLKRQYQIERGELVYFFDSDLAVEDEILRLELSKASDAKIKTIIHSIQKEQNAAIRSEATDVLVFGPAGSGKTSVGLHRLAYLLYRHRDNLSSRMVRIFSPSPIFASYIEGIIPDLGEEDVETLDFASLMEEYSPGRRPFHDQYQLIEYLQAAPQHDPRRKWLEEKYSIGFINHLENYIKTYAPTLEDVSFNQDILCNKDRLTALYADRTSAGTLATKTTRVMTYVEQRYNEYYKANRRQIAELFNAIHEDDLSDGEIRRLYEEEKSIVNADLRSRLMPKAKRIYERALASWGKTRHIPMQHAREALRQELLYFEDAIMLLYIDILTGRIKPEKNVKHILIDEAQDVSVIQHRTLKRLFPSSHFTVLADVNQALYPCINLHTQTELENQYPKAKTIPLTTSYRSTYEISRFAANILAGDSNAVDMSAIYTRRGDEPAIIQAQNPAAATWEIIRKLPKEYNTVGILLTTAKEARKFYDQLLAAEASTHDGIQAAETTPSDGAQIAKTTPCDGTQTAETTPPGAANHTPPAEDQGNIGQPKLIASTNASFGQGLMVMALPYAKGLEFDAVICPQYGQPVFDGPLGRKMLYLVCTRALHNLYLLQS